MKPGTKFTLIPILILNALFIIQPSCAQEKITFDKGIGFYVLSGNKTDFLYWTAEHVGKGKMGWIENFEEGRYFDVL